MLPTLYRLSISGIVIALGVPRRDWTVGLSDDLPPRVTGIEEGYKAGISAGRFPAPAGDMCPGRASCTMHGVPPDCAICAHSFQVSKCGEERVSEWQTTSQATERTEICMVTH